MARNKGIGLWEQIAISHKVAYVQDPTKILDLDLFELFKEQYLREIDELLLTETIDKIHANRLRDLINSSDKESNELAVNILKTYQCGHIYKKK